MWKLLYAVLGLLALNACSNQGLGPSTGKPFALNPGYWTPTTADLAVEGDQ